MMTRCKNCFKEYDESFGICPYCGYEDGEMPVEAFCVMPGTIIRDRYAIGQVLGIGGFGIIYKAWDKKLDTILAIKEYYPSGLVNRLPGKTEVILVASKREREFVYGKARFLEEARNMAKFSTHKNIVNVFDFFEANNTAYIVMEFLDGKTMSQALQQQNVPFSYDHCIRIASDVCEALRAIHKENILHRDISPDNIMLCNNGTVKLLDFGAARFSAGIDSRVTVIVKPGFAPPEQYDKVNRQDLRTDIYALGATLYYALTGTKPEESTNRKVADTLKEPSQLDKSIPQQISTAVMRAMAVEPQYRFSSVDEFEKALFSEKRVSSVKKEKSRRNLRRVLGIVASFLIIAGAALAFTYNWNKQRVASMLPDADLIMFFILNEDETTNVAKETALQLILDSFTNEYDNVSIELKGVHADNYSDVIESNLQKEENFIFESTGLSEDALTFALEVPEASEDSFRREGLDRTNQFPVGIIAPIIYVNTSLGTIDSADTLEDIISSCQIAGEYLAVERSAIGMYSTLYGSEIADYYVDSAKEDFLGGNVLAYLGKSSDYSEVQTALAGRYAIMMPGGGSSTYEYGTLWSLSKMSDDSAKVARAVLEYLNTELGQEYLHIQAQSDELPILTSTLQEYLRTYSELSGLADYLGQPFATPETDIDKLLANADSSRLNDLIVNAKFEDVAENSWYAEAIANVCANGYMEGKTEQQFNPDDPATRAELITAVYRMAGSPEVDSQPPFSDINSQSELGKAVAWAYEAGIVSESSDSKFNGDGVVNLETTLVMFYRAAPELGFEQAYTSTVGQYADGSEISSWAIDAVMWGIDHDVTTVELGGSIFPKSAVSRGRLAVLLVRLLSVNEDASSVVYHDAVVGEEVNDSYAEIPQTIVQTGWDGLDEYRPMIKFTSDNQCVFTINMAEWMTEAVGSYAVYEYTEGLYVIECYFGGDNVSTGIERYQRTVYLAEIEHDVWMYYGESSGLTTHRQMFESDGAGSIQVEYTEQNGSIDSSFVGTWHSNQDLGAGLYVKSIDDGIMIYNMGITRLTAFHDQNAICCPNGIAFGYLESRDSDDESIIYSSTYVVMTMTEDAIFMTICGSEGNTYMKDLIGMTYIFIFDEADTH